MPSSIMVAFFRLPESICSSDASVQGSPWLTCSACAPQLNFAPSGSKKSCIPQSFTTAAQFHSDAGTTHAAGSPSKSEIKVTTPHERISIQKTVPVLILKPGLAVSSFPAKRLAVAERRFGDVADVPQFPMPEALSAVCTSEYLCNSMPSSCWCRCCC